MPVIGRLRALRSRLAGTLWFVLGALALAMAAPAAGVIELSATALVRDAADAGTPSPHDRAQLEAPGVIRERASPRGHAGAASTYRPAHAASTAATCVWSEWRVSKWSAPSRATKLFG